MIHNHLLDPALRTADINDCENNFAWQWRNIPEGNESTIKIEVIGITIFGSKESNYPPIACLHEALYNKDEIDSSFDWLINGQRHNGKVQEQYKRVMTALGKENFWRLIAESTGPIASDWQAVTDNLKWQNQANPATIQAAKDFIKNERELDAVFYLLLGQKHNDGAMITYRWAAKTDLPKLFNIVSQL